MEIESLFLEGDIDTENEPEKVGDDTENKDVEEDEEGGEVKEPW